MPGIAHLDGFHEMVHYLKIEFVPRVTLTLAGEVVAAVGAAVVFLIPHDCFVDIEGFLDVLIDLVKLECVLGI